MGRAPCCEKVGLKRGRWTKEEDQILIKYIKDNGEGSWRALPKNAGLLRCGKSCRLRWINYLRTDLKRGNITPQEEDLIIKLHATIGNRWSLIATQLSGRTDNEIKNYWNSHLSRSINTWRRPANDTLPKHILENLAKLMAKPDPSIKKETKKIAPIKTIATTDRDNNKPKTHDDQETEDNNNEKHTTSNNSWITDQSFESIFSLEDHQDLVEEISLNEMVTPLMDNLITMPDQHEHAFQNLDDDGAIDLDFFNNLMTNFSTSHAEMDITNFEQNSVDDFLDIPITMDNNLTLLNTSLSSSSSSSSSSPYLFDDYGETLFQEEVGSSFLMPWIWDCDDVGSYGM